MKLRWALAMVLGVVNVLGLSISRAPAALRHDILEGMYRTELGDKFNAADLPRLFEAHTLIEQYFTADSSQQRSDIVHKIDANGLDPGVVGRLVRIRMNWQPLESGVYFINEQAGPNEVRYFLGVPKGYDFTRPWPLIVRLPVENAFLTNPPPDADRVVQIYTQWIETELAAHPDALVLMPLLNLDHLYGPGTTGMNLVMQPILNASGKANIDPARVYLIGHSMAARAVWNIAISYPTYFAGLDSLAGTASQVWQRVRLANLRNTRAVMWNDASDREVDIEEARELWRFLVRIKYDVDFTQTTDFGHIPPPAIVEDQYQKLRKAVRPLYPKTVFIQSSRLETIFNRCDWAQIYQPNKPGPARKVMFQNDGESMMDYEFPFRILATLGPDPNVITLDLRNARTVRLYLNDQMVDFSRPVTVLNYGKPVFHGMVKQSIDEMLKDQLFLGRGWRYYTGVIDIDFGEPAATQPVVPPVKRGTIDFTAPDGEQKTWSTTQNSKSGS
jgi:hypothetical protein